MYSTCLFCHADLGRNEVLESFPVGRRLAYDAARGRLWVVCRRCERWNLTPLEERWLAIDEAEREYRATRTRVATDEIGLARTREGTELVRIGKPLRPEFAAWRYGGQFGRRYRRTMVYYGAGTAAVLASALGSHFLSTVGVVGSVGTLLQLAHSADFIHRTKRRIWARVRLPDGHVAKLTRQHLLRSQLIAEPETGGWAMTMHYRGSGTRFSESEASVTLSGEEARRAVVAMLPGINAAGANAATVQDALTLLEKHSEGSAQRIFMTAARTRGAYHGGDSPPHSLGRLSLPMLLALEMASHEEQERRAMDGELALLEAAWKDAEALAKIADAL